MPPVLLDLCGLTILHRFSSPSWWEHLIKHVSADFTGTDAFDQVVKLQVRIPSDQLHKCLSLIRLSDGPSDHPCSFRVDDF